MKWEVVCSESWRVYSARSTPSESRAMYHKLPARRRHERLHSSQCRLSSISTSQEADSLRNRHLHLTFGSVPEPRIVNRTPPSSHNVSIWLDGSSGRSGLLSADAESYPSVKSLHRRILKRPNCLSARNEPLLIPRNSSRVSAGLGDRK